MSFPDGSLCEDRGRMDVVERVLNCKSGSNQLLFLPSLSFFPLFLLVYKICGLDWNTVMWLRAWALALDILGAESWPRHLLVMELGEWCAPLNLSFPLWRWSPSPSSVVGTEITHGKAPGKCHYVWVKKLEITVYFSFSDILVFSLNELLVLKVFFFWGECQRLLVKIWWKFWTLSQENARLPKIHLQFQRVQDLLELFVCELRKSKEPL